MLESFRHLLEIFAVANCFEEDVKLRDAQSLGNIIYNKRRNKKLLVILNFNFMKSIRF